jgi:hypothetical protein
LKRTFAVERRPENVLVHGEPNVGHVGKGRAWDFGFPRGRGRHGPDVHAKCVELAVEVHGRPIGQGIEPVHGVVTGGVRSGVVVVRRSPGRREPNWVRDEGRELGKQRERETRVSRVRFAPIIVCGGCVEGKGGTRVR